MREKWRKKRMRRLKRKRRQNRKWSASTSYLNYLFILPYYHFFLVTSSVLEHAKGNKRKIYCFAHSRKNYLRTKTWTIDEEGSKLKGMPNLNINKSRTIFRETERKHICLLHDSRSRLTTRRITRSYQDLLKANLIYYSYINAHMMNE